MSNLLTPEEVAAILKVEPRLLSEWRVKRVNLPYIKIGHRVRYRESDVRAWLDAQMRVAS